jgi:hypothetical protein
LFLFVIPAEAGIQEGLRSNECLFNYGLLGESEEMPLNKKAPALSR